MTPMPACGDAAHIATRKNAARKAALAARDAIPPADRARKSAAICDELLASARRTADAAKDGGEGGVVGPDAARGADDPHAAGGVSAANAADVADGTNLAGAAGDVDDTGAADADIARTDAGNAFDAADRNDGAYAPANSAALKSDAFSGFSVCVYAAMKSEVDVGCFARAMANAGARVAYPCMVRDARGERRMEMRLIGSRFDAPFVAHPLRTFRYGNDGEQPAELAAFARMEPEDFDMVIVPLVAFDTAGRRLGYGGGNYDAFLPHVRQDALVAGVGFEEQRLDAVPTEAHDLGLPIVVSA